MKKFTQLVMDDLDRMTVVTKVHNILDDDRKRKEELGKYEHCALLRDACKKLSNYRLGYSEWNEEIIDIIYLTCLGDGELIEELENFETYALDGMFFTFDVNIYKNKKVKK